MNIFDEEQVAAGWPSHPCTRAALPGIPWRCAGCEVEGVVGLICAIYAWQRWCLVHAMIEAAITASMRTQGLR